jgi:rubrerythrin
MPTRQTQGDVSLLADLNDLLRLDHDAAQAYTLAIALLRDEGYKRALTAFRTDHERHIDALVRAIRERGGVPIQLPHLPTGVFKLAVQAAGAAGGDRGLLLAFKANERLARDKYRRAAGAARARALTTLLGRHAADEQRHYSWVLETLDDLGVGQDTAVGAAERVVEFGHSRMADAIEGVERQATVAGETVRRAVAAQAARTPWGAALMALGAGFLAGQFVGRGRD